MACVRRPIRGPSLVARAPLRLPSHSWGTMRDNPAQCPSPPAARVAGLDEADKAQRRSAHRLGQSHALARGPARRANGSVVGRGRF
eukprot:9022166-Pyramimonas_sp.AAC.1